MTSKVKEIQLVGEGKRYLSMTQALLSDARFAKCLAEVTQPSVHDKLSSALVNTTFEVGASLSIIRALINLEFDRKWQHPTTILRVNSIVSKMTEKVGDEYIKLVLGKNVLNVNDQPDLRLDPNPNNIKEGNVEELSAQYCKNLDEYCQLFFDRMVDSEVVNEMPRELRAICYFIESAGDKYQLDKEGTVYPLISGFVMLRYLCPAITLPHLSGILPKLPEGEIRNNLTNIAKIIQKLANQEKFDVETPHLMGMNDFISRNKSKLIEYLKALSRDPWGKNFEDYTKPLNFETLHLLKFSTDDLKLMHGFIYDQAYDLQAALQNECLASDRRLITFNSAYIGMIQELGVPEGKGKPPVTDGKDATPVKKKETIDCKTPQEVEASLVKKCLDFMVSKMGVLKSQEIESSKVFYVGKPAKDKSPVLYLVMHRLQKNFFSEEQIDSLLMHVFQTIIEKCGSNYSLVIDMSWIRLEEEYLANVTKAFALLNEFLLNEHTATLQNIWLVQPTSKNAEQMASLLSVLDEDLKKKMKTIFDWRDLDSAIENNSIWIPYVSKKFVPLCHPVNATLGSEKKDVLLKVTCESIIIVDVKAGIVYKEIQFASMNVGVYDQKTSILKIQYTPAKKTLFADPLDVTIKLKTDIEDGILSVLCNDVQALLIIESILSSASKLVAMGGQRLTFKVLKEAAEEKTFPRIMKLTCDSILNFNDQHVIKNEIPYSTIQTCYVDKEATHRLIINYLANGDKRSYVVQSKKAAQIREAILDAIHNYKTAIRLDIDLYRSIKIDTCLTKFFSGAVKTKLYDYSSLNFNIEGVMKSFKELFAKFSTDKNNMCPFSLKRIEQYCESTKLDISESEIAAFQKLMDPASAGALKVFKFVDVWNFIRRATILLERRTKMIEERKAK